MPSTTHCKRKQTCGALDILDVFPETKGTELLVWLLLGGRPGGGGKPRKKHLPCDIQPKAMGMSEDERDCSTN